MGHLRNPRGILAFVRRYPTPEDEPPDAVIYCHACATTRPAAEFYVARARARIAAGQRIGAYRCRRCAGHGSEGFRHARMDLVAAAKASGCVDCGLRDPARPYVFDFDHVRPGKVKSVAAWVTSGSIEDLAAEIARCEVVCANCHRIRTHQRGASTRGRDRVR